jgi:hypothetical protein
MSRLVKLSLVAVLALMLVPYSYANEWVPPEMIKAFQAPDFQPDHSGAKDNLAMKIPDNPKDVKTSGKQATNSSVQPSPLNHWIPLESIRTRDIRTWVIPFDP